MPVNFAVEFNFTRLETMEFSWRKASLVYLPLGNLQALYDIFEGNDRRVHPGGLLADNFVITAALDASDYELRVKSSYDFSPDLIARMREISELGGEVKYTVRSEREAIVSVKNSTGYVTALDGVRWRDVRVGRPNR
ncbi:MAG: hypothetical protein ACOZQL_37955 [Myxococcota bacterium]